MNFIRRLISFFVVLIFIGYGGYFGFLNMNKLYVNIPYLGEYTIPGFLAFLTAFVLGGFFAALFFGYDFFRKSFEVHKSRRALSRIKNDRFERSSRFLEEDNEPRPSREPSLR